MTMHADDDESGPESGAEPAAPVQASRSPSPAELPATEPEANGGLDDPAASRTPIAVPGSPLKDVATESTPAIREDLPEAGERRSDMAAAQVHRDTTAASGEGGAVPGMTLLTPPARPAPPEPPAPLPSGTVHFQTPPPFSGLPASTFGHPAGAGFQTGAGPAFPGYGQHPGFQGRSPQTPGLIPFSSYATGMPYQAPAPMGHPQPQGVPETPMHLQQMQMQMQMIEQQRFQMQEFTRIMDEMQARASESERRHREMRDADDARHQADMQRMQTEIERAAAAMTRGGTTSSTAATGSNTNRRHSIFIANSEFDAAAIDKALHQFKCESTFSGLKSEDVDGFLRTLDRAIQHKDPKLRVLFLDRQLRGAAAQDFQQAFPDIHEADYQAACDHLRARHRALRHRFKVITAINGIKQLGSVTAMFNYLDGLRYKLADHDEEYYHDAVLVALMFNGLKPAISKRLKEDSTKLRDDHTLEQLQADALAIEMALGDGNGGGGAHRTTAAVADVAPYDRTVADKSNPMYEAHVAQRVKDGHIQPGEIGPRPAYEHPRWYRRDGGACRYCKAITHNTALCKKLYNKVNGSEMPSDLISANTKILAAAD